MIPFQIDHITILRWAIHVSVCVQVCLCTQNTGPKSWDTCGRSYEDSQKLLGPYSQACTITFKLRHHATIAHAHTRLARKGTTVISFERHSNKDIELRQYEFKSS